MTSPIWQSLTRRSGTWIAVGALAAAALVLGTRAPGERAGPGDPFAEAIGELVAKIEEDPGLYPVRAQLGAAYLHRARARGTWEDVGRAEAELLRSLELQETEEALRWLAAVRLDQHRFAEAEQVARRAIEAWPQDGIARAVLGDALLARGEVEAARTAYEGAPGEATDFYSLAGYARCLFETGDSGAAIATLRAALAGLSRERETPEARRARAWCRLMIGSCLLETGSPAEALAEYDAALRLDPHSAEIKEHRAEWEAIHGERDDAVRRYEEIVRGIERPDLLAKLGELEGEGGRVHLERAEAIWRTRLRGGDISVRRSLALHLLSHGGDAAEALQLAREDLETRRDALAHDTLAWALFRNGQVEAALSEMQDFVRNGPRLRIIEDHRAAIEAAATAPRRE